eukprot:3767514-Pleurochrysis_carterae.AAC.2
MHAALMQACVGAHPRERIRRARAHVCVAPLMWLLSRALTHRRTQAYQRFVLPAVSLRLVVRCFAAARGRARRRVFRLAASIHD